MYDCDCEGEVDCECVSCECFLYVGFFVSVYSVEDEIIISLSRADNLFLSVDGLN